MDNYPLIAGHFQSTIECIMHSVDELAAPLELAGVCLSDALLNDRKILTCGIANDGALAQLFVSNLLGRFEQERPALPALCLSADSISLTAVASSDGPTEIFARQISALGQADDVLLCINSGNNRPTLARALQAAHGRNMRCVLLSNEQARELPQLLGANDVALQVAASRRPLISEIHTIALNCLCELIDHSLFGAYPGTEA